MYINQIHGNFKQIKNILKDIPKEDILSIESIQGSPCFQVVFNDPSKQFWNSIIHFQNPYLAQIDITDKDYDYQKSQMILNHLAVKHTCSCVWKNGLFGRTLDDSYDQTCQIIVRTKKTDKIKHSSIGISRVQGITKNFMFTEKWVPHISLIPFMLTDGMNDAGVVCVINSMPTGDNPLNKASYQNITTGTKFDGKNLHILAAVRFVLDNADSAQHAVQLLKTMNIFSGAQVRGQQYSIMTADENRCFVIQFIDNQIKVIQENSSVLTNFYLYGYDGVTDDICIETVSNANVVFNRSLTKHSNGTERYKILKDGYESVNDIKSMYQLMKQVWYRKHAYDNSLHPFWYSEYAADWGEKSYGNLTVDSKHTDYYDIVSEYDTSYTRGYRDSTTLITSHTSLYDIPNRKIIIIPQQSQRIQDKRVLDFNF